MVVTMIEAGFIKLHRQILDWEWYSDINTTRVFIHLLLTANYEPKKWKGIDVARGSLVTSYPKLAEKTSLTVQQVRTSLSKLKSTGEITASKGLNYTLISIACYDDYQTINALNNRQITDNQQTDNRQITTTKEVKKERNKEYNIINDDWQPSDSILKNIKDRGYQQSQIEKTRQQFINTILATNNKYKYKNFDRAFLNWITKEQPAKEENEFLRGL